MIKNKYFFALTVAVLTTLTACDDDDDGADTGITPQSTEVDNLLLSNHWIVESLIDDGADETADFADFVLTFSAQGQVAADHNTAGDLSRKGTYRVYTDDGKIELEMNFPNPGIIDDLNDDWYFVLQSGTSLLWDDEGDVLILARQ